MDSEQSPANTIGRFQIELQGVLEGVEVEGHTTRHLLLELLAARAIQRRQNISAEESLEILARELDTNCLLLRSQYKPLYDNLESLVTRFDLDNYPIEQTLQVIESVSQNTPQKRQDGSGVYYFPSWLTHHLGSLAIPDAPFLFLDFGRSWLLPQIVERYREGNKPIEFVSLDRNTSIVEGLRLALAIIHDDLDQVREAVTAFAEQENKISAETFPLNTLNIRAFGTIYFDLFPSSPNVRDRVELDHLLSEVLTDKLTANGRFIILAPAFLLSNKSWQTFRETLLSIFHLEAIVELPANTFAPDALVKSALILLRKPQQAITRRVTLFTPQDPDSIQQDPDAILTKLKVQLEQEEPPEPNTNIFERPTSELTDRWDPKFNSPLRLQLQNQLINSSQVTWLESIVQLITRGPSPAALQPYIQTHLAGISFEGRQKNLAGLKSGTEVWLRREPDNSHDPNAIHVERRSGISLGYIPAELAAKLADALDEINGRYPATIVRLQGGTSNQPTLGVTIQFAPPQYAQTGEPVTVIRPRDITNHRLTGSGESAWLLASKGENSIRLKANDILLHLHTRSGKACVVPGAFEGSVCHRDLAIIRPSPDIDPYYLLSFILGSEFQQQLYFVARDNALATVDLDDLRELLVIVPPLASQRRIAWAFAESQGQLGPDLGTGVEQWLRLAQDPTTVDGLWLDSSLLSSLFTDWDQIRTFDDWLRMKSNYVRELRNAIAHGQVSFNDPGLNTALMILYAIHRAIEHLHTAPKTQEDARRQAGEMLVDLRNQLAAIQNDFLRSRFINLALMLTDLLQARSAPLPLDLRPESLTLPTTIPALLRLFVTNEGQDNLIDFELTPQLSSGEILELPAWQLNSLASGETYTFEARLRFQVPGVVYLTSQVSYFRDGIKHTQSIPPLKLEAIPLDQLPFTPIEPNPYITGGAVESAEMFFGRQDVLNFLHESLIGAHQNNVIILQGNRRTGKSSILKQIIVRDLFSPHIPVYIDCQGLGQLNNQKFFYKIAREIWKALAKRDDIQKSQSVRRGDISEDDPFYDFRELLDELIPSGRHLILLIDEFEVIDMAIRAGTLDPIVLENLRHLFQHRRDLAVILTGSYRLSHLRQEYWSILFGLGLKRNIGFLDEEAARQLITQPLRDIVTYAPEAINRIIELTACQPLFVQMVCHNLVNQLNTHKSNYVTLRDVEEAAQETLTSASDQMQHMFSATHSPVLQAILIYMAGSLTEPDDTILLHQIKTFIDQHRLSINDADLTAALREMSERDLVQIQGPVSQRQYRFKIDLFRQWLRRNQDLNTAIERAQNVPYVGEDET